MKLELLTFTVGGEVVEALTRRNFLLASASGGLAVAGLGWGETAQAADVDKAGSGFPLKTETATVAMMLSPQIKGTLSKLQMRQAMAEASVLMNSKEGERAHCDVIPIARHPCKLLHRRVEKKIRGGDRP